VNRPGPTCPPGQHDDEVIARAGTLTLELCRRCGMRRVRGLDRNPHLPRTWLPWFRGETDERPPDDAGQGRAKIPTE
jgi:hypothetical protein